MKKFQPCTARAKFDPQKHHRRSIRLEGYDYTQPAAYFVTLVAWQRECLFGEVKAGDMRPNHFGRLAENEWRRLGIRFTQVVVDEWTVMPNHVHEILVIVSNGVAQSLRGMAGQAAGAVPGSLGAIVGTYKSTAARLINGLRRTPGAPVWQRNFYDRIIRNDNGWLAIRAYIQDNPLKWELDSVNPTRSETA